MALATALMKEVKEIGRFFEKKRRQKTFVFVALGAA